MKKTTFLSGIWLLLLWLISQEPVAAQARITISGTVQDAASGENLTGATVRVLELPGVGTGANAYGFYTLTVPAGAYTLEASFVGYRPQQHKTTTGRDQRLLFDLAPEGKDLAEVVVKARTADANISKAQMGVETINLRQIANVPVLFGEKDVLKTLTLLPGIKSAGEGNSGFSVRGGGFDQNLILLDEAPVYNASHLLGFFSTFNSDALKDMTVYKGGMPAQYGGRLSSVVDIKMKEGNNQQFHGSGGIGLISSRLALEGPIVRDKGSFIITGRRTYADVFLQLSSNPTTKKARLYFYDLNAKANYRLNARNRIYFSGYLGHDALGLSGTFGQSYGNQTATLRLNHLFSDRLFSNTSVIYSKYDYQITLISNGSESGIDSKIQDLNLKQDFEFTPTATQTIRFGAQAIHHTITPGHVTAATDATVNPTPDRTNYSLETAVYASHEWQAAPGLNFTTGLRLSGFSLLGPGTYSTYDGNGNTVTTSTYTEQDGILKTYVRLEPRFSASYQLSEASTVKLGYARNVQNLHLLSNTNASSPTDLYVPTSFNVKPERSDQVSAGYYLKLGKDNAYSLTVETYYKSMQNQIDYRNGTDLTRTYDAEANLLYGTGRAYGIEFLLRKDVGRLTGWLGYTFSRTERQFTGINRGSYFPAKQDRPHDLSVVAIYQLNPRWTVSGTFLYSTGNAVTFPAGKYAVSGQPINYYGPRNAGRTPAYIRMDLGATYEKPGQQHHRFRSSWSFSVYNALGRENTYSILFRANKDDPTRTEAVQESLFRWIPSATYNFTF